MLLRQSLLVLTLLSTVVQAETIISSDDFGASTPRDEVLHSDPYRWLEESSIKREYWRDQQIQLTDSYFNGMGVIQEWEIYLQRQMEKTTVIQRRRLRSGYELRLLNQGLKQPNEIALFRNKQKIKTLFTTNDLENSDTSNFIEFYVSPKDRYIIVPASNKGSTDVADLYIVDIEEAEVVQRIFSVTAHGVVWVSPNEFIVNHIQGRGFVPVKHRVDGDRFMTFVEEDLNNSPSGRFLLKRTNGGVAIRSVSDDRWLEIKDFMGRIVVESKNAMFAKSYKKGEEKLIRFEWSFSPSHMLQLKSKKDLTPKRKAEFLKGFTSLNFAALVYMWGQERWVEVINAQGTKVAEIPLSSEIRIKSFKVINRDIISFKMSSPIIMRQSIDFNLESKSFVRSNLVEFMMTDKKGVRYKSEYLEAKSADGTAIPIRIVYRADLILDGSNPLLVEGYGGFSLVNSFLPRFSVLTKKFLEDGGIYAGPALRGGSEFGDDCHSAGKYFNKQNVFDDMIASIELLHAKKFSSPEKTAIMGWSNGGLLVGSVLTQRPDLLKLAIPGNGVLDMLRKDILDYQFGLGWSFEYGGTNNAKSFHNLQSYSPLVLAEQPQKYPTTLVVSGRYDSRVNPAHSYKFVSSLQNSQQASNPVLLLDVDNAGHWATLESLQGKFAFDALVRIWSTIYHELGMSAAIADSNFRYLSSDVSSENVLVEEDEELSFWQELNNLDGMQ